MNPRRLCVVSAVSDYLLKTAVFRLLSVCIAYYVTIDAIVLSTSTQFHTSLHCANYLFRNGSTNLSSCFNVDSPAAFEGKHECMF